MFYNVDMNTRCSARTKHESSGKGHPVPAPTRHALVVCPDPLPDPDQPLDSIDKIIRNLAAMQARLSLLIDAQRDTTDTLAPLLALRTEIDSRLARLHHDQQVLASHAAVGASADRARTLDQIREHVDASDLVLPADAVARLDEVSLPEPRYPYRFGRDYAARSLD